MKEFLLSGAAIAVIVTLQLPAAQAETEWLDLTHPIPTFSPITGNPTRTDYDAPWLDSKPHVTWYE